MDARTYALNKIKKHIEDQDQPHSSLLPVLDIVKQALEQIEKTTLSRKEAKELKPVTVHDYVCAKKTIRGLYKTSKNPAKHTTQGLDLYVVVDPRDLVGKVHLDVKDEKATLDYLFTQADHD